MSLVLSALAHIGLIAQATGATVAGTVTAGDTGLPLVGATVSLVDLDRVAVTDPQGRYILGDVPPGPQHVAVRRVGFAPRTFHALVPAQGTLVINVALRALPVTLQPLEVESAVPVRGLESESPIRFPDRGLSIAAIRNHPLLPEPDALLATAGGEVVVRPESPSGIHVRGGASDQLAYLLDGIPAASPYRAAGTFGTWNPDAIAAVDLVTTTPSPALPDALSGAVSARTRSPSSTLRAQGALSTTQARATIDGPLGRAGSGYLLSIRSTFPGLLAHRREPSYLAGESVDWLAKVEAPVLGGRALVLSYGNADEITAAVRPEIGGTPERDPPRHAFRWNGWSVGASWTGPVRGAELRVQGFSVAGDAGATWARADSAVERLTSERRETGLVATIELLRPGRSTLAGLRALRGRTSYDFDPSGDRLPLSFRVESPVSAAFLRHTRSLTSTAALELSLSGALAGGGFRLSPGGLIRWMAADAVELSLALSRRHQFAQSLRNPESVVANIFPVDLPVGAADSGVPTARSDLGVLAVDYRPTAGTRVGAQAYARGFDGLALVAPRDADPFATTGFVRGGGSARGLALEAAASGARFGLIASYGLQRVRLSYADSTYTPDHGSTHWIDAGAVVFPSPSTAVRVSVAGIFGRRATAVLGPLEWEACNLADRGCEFAGTPGLSGPLGGTSVPGYLRLDLGLRKHWHVDVGGRDAQVTVFGTVTNLLGRANVLTVAVDPATGERQRIEMRPRSPLVVGVEWRF